MSLLDGLIVFIALLLGVGLWLRWQLRAHERRPSHRLTRPSAHDSSAFVETTPLGDGPVSPARPLDDDQDDGPATVMSYMDVPTNTRPQSEFSASNLSSLFPEDIDTECPWQFKNFLVKAGD